MNNLLRAAAPFALLAPLALAACQTPPPSPPMQAGIYHAVGEPGWTIKIDPRTIYFIGDYGERRINQPTPRPIIGVAGEIYQTSRLNVNIVHARCSDGLSDRDYPDTVQVTADGRRYEGCGGAAGDPAALAGSSWTVVAIEGRLIPRTGLFFMNFEATRFGAKFGCNGLGADYTQAGDTVTAGPVIGTKMACPDMSFENQGSAILSRPMRMKWSGGDRLTLLNDAGRIDIRRRLTPRN